MTDSEYDDPFYSPEEEDYDGPTEDDARDAELAAASRFTPPVIPEITFAPVQGINLAGLYGGATMSGVFRVGERVKVVGNTSQHNIPLNTVLTVRGYNGQFVMVAENGMSYWEVDLQSVPLRIEDVRNDFRRAEAAFLKARSRLRFMEETKAEELNEAEFREYMIEELLRADMSMADRVREIEALFTGQQQKSGPYVG